jgi:sterol desaturase/sphingolipid hydroxylase (fatty acid hydroxylase superfamily)
VSTLAVILIHDTYFYWTHRWMHHPSVYRWVHAVHHRSTAPTPWAAFAFHPIEAVIESGSLVPLVWLVPLHPGAILISVIYLALMNVLGHLGYEFFPAWVARTGLWDWQNVTTHHDWHHRTMRGNYSLYFNFWDRVCGTNDPAYRAQFLALKRAALDP